MSKGAPQYPTPPDPTKIIGAQENSNFNTAQMQQLMNMMGSTNPFGTFSYNQTGTQNIDGHQVPIYSSNFQLNPQFQDMLKPLDFSSNNTSLMQLNDPKLLQHKTTNAIYDQATRMLDPQWDKNNKLFSDQLANQGIMPGTAAYDHAMQDHSMAQNDAYSQARNSAITGGEQAANQLFGEQLSGRQQGINEMLTGQNQPISALSQIMAAMRGGSNPQTAISPTDVTGAYNTYQQQLQNQYQAQMGQYQSMMGGLGSLFGDALPFFF